jgi:RecG-like helicase
VKFAESFGFEETPDQAAAIAAVIGDMTSGKPMDRLVCGDVGFGKTEVALRAAFIAVMGGKQVALLSPTTLLAEQHRPSPTASPTGRCASSSCRASRPPRKSMRRSRRSTKAASTS